MQSIKVSNPKQSRINHHPLQRIKLAKSNFTEPIVWTEYVDEFVLAKSLQVVGTP